MSKERIEKLYTCFQQKDWPGMQSCYHDRARFSDPVFQHLQAKEVRAMWHMLVLSGKDLTVSFGDVQADEVKGSCHWEATYTFSRSGRRVHNVIEATFGFADGKIILHHDQFNFWRWAGMALGWPGKLMGWSAVVQEKVRGTAQNSLSAFISEHPEYQ
jgi:hypothetical protein